MKQENFPYHVIGTVGSDEASILNDGQLQAENKRRAEAQPPEGPLAPSRTQTFIINEFESLDEFVNFPAPPEVLLDIVNRAARLKQQVAAKKLIEDPNFEVVDGVYDMASSIAEVVERRKMSDEDKAIKALDKLPPEVRAALIQKLLEAQTAPSA